MSEFRNDQPDPAASDDAALVARVAPPLRQPEKLGGGFESRVMDAVRAEASAAHAAEAARKARGGRIPARGTFGWLLRPRELRLSPLGALALAAGFAAIVSLGTLGVAQRGRLASQLAPLTSSAPGVQVVRFVFVDSAAAHVAVAGDFNGWDTATTPLAPTGVHGVWSVAVPLHAGRYEYAFIVDHKRWTPDPLERKSTDEFNTESSVVTVGDSER
jgi:hypothetical protein